MDFTDARHTARMTREEVAQYLDLSPRTIARYEQTGKAPKAVIECLLMIGGYCPTFSRRNDFNGWHFGNGFLWSPAGDRFTSGDVLASRIDRALVRGLERENIKLRQFKSSVLAGKRNSNIVQFPVKHRHSQNLIA